MKKFKISNDKIAELSNAPLYEFPKYVTQVINLVNSNAGGTRPKVVGQMSELIKEFDGKTITEWIEWYSERYPNAVDNATEKIWDMYETMKGAFNAITKDMVENWLKDLVYGKTFCGLKFQTAIISAIANQLGKEWRQANPEEEAKGIDGFMLRKYYDHVVGIYVNEDLPIVKLKLRVYGVQMEYMRMLPLHKSQSEVKSRYGEFAEFTYWLCLTPELKSKILALGASVEVLEPLEYREEIMAQISSSLDRYMKK